MLRSSVVMRAWNGQKEWIGSKFFLSGMFGVRMMGGGPRTFPGGVTKWQWKRMQEKKQKEKDKQWLAKERHLYEKRRRAQLLALIPPPMPWERQVHREPPPLPEVDTHPKVRAMANRFQRKNDATDLWNQNDEPTIENSVHSGYKSSRFIRSASNVAARSTGCSDNSINADDGEDLAKDFADLKSDMSLKFPASTWVSTTSSSELANQSLSGQQHDLSASDVFSLDSLAKKN